MATAPGPFDQFASELREFERLVRAQRPVGAQHYDEQYFAADWREGGNRYELETRREIEGRNPALIVEALRPERVLDVGCGPGFLMLFLAELGVEVDGVDFSPSSLELAPPEIRERISIGPVDRLAAADHSYDLLLCRETIEHLTVLQARRTVAEMCRVSSRLVYVTTRFHPAPAGLLDVTTDFETDPTHISLMTKDLLRLFFVLDGYGARPDLEERLDWGRKGRVLVYERAADALES